MPVKTKTKVVAREVTYKIHYTYPWCADDDSPWHIENWSNSSQVVEATSDKEAQLASLAEEFHKKEHCRHGRYARPTKIEKIVVETTEDGFNRTTTSNVPLPQARRCPCGKTYMPVRGESACHKLEALPKQ